jgi:hypothetical protein
VLVVGITNPDPWQVRDEPTEPARGAPPANPCTYYERHLMVEMTVHGAWGEAKVQRFEELGLRVVVVWRRTRKTTTATEVREAIRCGRPWDHLVPAATAGILRDLDVLERIRRAEKAG